jgi:hypothetical protein
VSNEGFYEQMENERIAEMLIFKPKIRINNSANN